MRELFEKVVMYACFAGIGGIAAAAFVRATLPAAAEKARAVAENARKHGVSATLVVAVFVWGLIVYGSTKNNSQTNEPNSQIILSPSTLPKALLTAEPLRFHCLK